MLEAFNELKARHYSRCDVRHGMHEDLVHRWAVDKCRFNVGRRNKGAVSEFKEALEPVDEDKLVLADLLAKLFDSNVLLQYRVIQTCLKHSYRFQR